MFARVWTVALVAAAAAVALAGPPSTLPPPAPPPIPEPLAPTPPPKDAPPPEPVVLERFTVPKGGDAFLVPVTMAGKQRLFLLDTGCSHTVVDSALLAGPALDVVAGNTPDGAVEGRVFAPPKASVGELGFEGVGAVIGFDLRPMREALGHPIDGLLGMDFLGRRVVRADFDRGEVLFLSAAGPGCGDPIPMRSRRGEVPKVRGTVAGAGEVEFDLDTGFGAVHGASLDPATFEALRRADALRVIGVHHSRSAAGDTARPLGRAAKLTVGPATFPDPVFDVSRRPLLGINFLARFVVTFDFPANALYLKAGAGAAGPAKWNRSGVRLLLRGGAAVLQAVSPDGPGAKAGVAAGDVLVSAGGAKAGAAGLYQFREALAAPGKLTVVVRRGDADHTLTLDNGP